MTAIIRLLASVLLVLVLSGAATAQTDPRALIDALARGGFDATQAAIEAIVAAGEARAVPALDALAGGNLYAGKADRRVVIGRQDQAGTLTLIDPLSGEKIGEASSRELDRIRVNNRLRRAVRSAISTLTLMSPDPRLRLAAAKAAYLSPDAASLEAIEAALAAESDADVRAALERARAAAVLASARPPEDKFAAIEVIAAAGDRDARAALVPLLTAGDERVRAAATAAIGHIDRQLALWEAGQNVWYGISLGSVLLLAAIGLAITFGVMGVINMAHGEMVMLGAYTTFTVQEALRIAAPQLIDWSLAVALPLAFLFSGAVGLVIERGVIRWLYGRPLETLLATWGLSLILQQAVRTVFGPTNRQVSNPSWMSGAFELGGLTVTYNRLWIVLFALATFAVLWVVLRTTAFGLQMRAVTQNRPMAASMGIRTPRVDALTFALGSGIAGIAGVALSQVDNVSPNLGQSYIIDSFMVVVFGGVGNIWGTLVGALSLGIVNKFLEPYAGAVLAKILVLVCIIFFIQKRPRGLFALKGRAAEA